MNDEPNHEHAQTRCGMTPLANIILRVALLWLAFGVMFLEASYSREPGVGFGVALVLTAVALVPWGSE